MTTCGARAARDAADTQRPAQAGLPASCPGLAAPGSGIGLASRWRGRPFGPATHWRKASISSITLLGSSRCCGASIERPFALRWMCHVQPPAPVRGVLMSFVGETVPTSPENALMPAASILTRCCPGRSSEQYYTDDMPRRFVFIRRSRVPRARVTLARRGRGTRTTAAVT